MCSTRPHDFFFLMFFSITLIPSRYVPIFLCASEFCSVLYDESTQNQWMYVVSLELGWGQLDLRVLARCCLTASAYLVLFSLNQQDNICNRGIDRLCQVSGILPSLTVQIFEAEPRKLRSTEFLAFDITFDLVCQNFFVKKQNR